MGPENWTQKLYKAGGCAWWVHILARAPVDERHPYRVLIGDSIDFQPYTLVLKSGHVSEDPEKCLFWPFCPLGKKSENFQKFFDRKIMSKDTLGIVSLHPKCWTCIRTHYANTTHQKNFIKTGIFFTRPNLGV